MSAGGWPRPASVTTSRRSIETASAPGSHLIGNEETRRIAESFLTASSSWLGNVTWQDIVAGPDAGYLAGWDGRFDPEKIDLSDGQRWSWSVIFTDPSGQQKTLSHETVLQGVRALVFWEDGPSRGRDHGPGAGSGRHVGEARRRLPHRR
jgi:hypothetical protein